MTVCMVISLLKILYIHRMHVCMYGFGQPYTCPTCTLSVFVSLLRYINPFIFSLATIIPMPPDEVRCLYNGFCQL